ncbi:hypothetical protein HJC23_011562 [Cyclotella cryptica]|uniref:HSF-type DNA-binding domain-containing protein n=1 Tax=Cyclotella cryptica TaxID=29204 RepID=A0ABD3P150_9STRA|eukprot:CCRYP_018435-RA/>CCRYP_018435-RA protein AED:0.39 eAED:-0.09 QI:0/-1/0/1/-1/1/1/0/440
MTSVMSGLHNFDPDPDEMVNSLDFCGEFDFEKEFVSDDHEFAPSPVPNRMGLSSPNASDGSTAAEHSASAEIASQQNFPVLLHEIVSSEEYDSIQWLPCGTFFVITDKEDFTKHVIPRFFDARGGTKFTSFTRRLKRWMFNRVASGANIGAYYHENFRRGEPELAANIVYPAKSKNKISPTVSSKAKIKARRRASTGCMADPGKFMEIGITPIPVKPSVLMSGTPVLPELDSDMTEFLSSPDFIKDDDPTLFAMPQTSASSTPATPPFSSSNFKTARVSDFSLKETQSPSQKFQTALAFQAQQLQNNLAMQSQTLIPNTSLNIMQSLPLAFPGGFNLGQQAVFHPQMRRHSCVPMFHPNDEQSSMFAAASGLIGASINPMLQVNNMRINQNMVNEKSSAHREQSAIYNSVPNFGDSTRRNHDQEDTWIDFDEFVSRQDDD